MSSSRTLVICTPCTPCCHWSECVYSCSSYCAVWEFNWAGPSTPQDFLLLTTECLHCLYELRRGFIVLLFGLSNVLPAYLSLIFNIQRWHLLHTIRRNHYLLLFSVDIVTFVTLVWYNKLLWVVVGWFRWSRSEGWPHLNDLFIINSHFFGIESCLKEASQRIFHVLLPLLYCHFFPYLFGKTCQYVISF